MLTTCFTQETAVSSVTVLCLMHPTSLLLLLQISRIYTYLKMLVYIYQHFLLVTGLSFLLYW